MRRLFIILATLIGLPAIAQFRPSVFLSPEADLSHHSRIAILPFYCIGDSSDYSKAPAYQSIQDKQLGLELQHTLYTLMMSFGNRFGVSIQDSYITNHLLYTAKTEDYRFPDMQSMASMLEVDAVLWCLVTHDPHKFLEDDSLKKFMQRQHIPPEAEKKDVFMSLFDTHGACFWTLSANGELLRNMLYFETNRIRFFQWMQYLPYWKGEKIKIL
jgi:hypothetical protein